MGLSEKVVLGLKRYVSPVPQPKMKPLEKQLYEYYGVGEFHCEQHNTLAQELIVSRNSYVIASSAEIKKRVAKNELAYWHKYITTRTEAKPENFTVSANHVRRIRKIWDKLRNRNEDTLACSRMLDFKLEYIDHYRFDIDIDDVCLAEMVHEHWGYLIHMPGHISIDQYLLLLSRKLLASYERFEGEELFAKQLSALAYWEIVDSDFEGSMDLQSLNRLLTAFRLPLVSDYDDIWARYSYTLKQLPNELEHFRAKPFVRFEFIKRIFMDHGL